MSTPQPCTPRVSINRLSSEPSPQPRSRTRWPGSTQPAGAIAVKRLGGIKGDRLTNAQQSFDQQTNEPVVTITFDQQGGAKFAKLTTDNVGKPFAIILDGKVLSSPVINEPIIGGTARISGRPLSHGST